MGGHLIRLHAAYKISRDKDYSAVIFAYGIRMEKPSSAMT